MDFYFVKVRIRSRATAEDMVGYLFGKAGKAPEFDFIVVPSRFAGMLKIDIESDYKDFMDTFQALKRKILEEVPESVELTEDFLNYLRVQINRKGADLFGAELSAAVKSEDAELVHFTITELIKGWTPRSEVSVSIKPMSMEELSMDNFLAQMEDLGDENLLEVLMRPDIKDLPEIFPIIDPIYGKSITEFDIGDPIFFVVLNAGSEEMQKQLETAFPNHFRGGMNVKPFVGTLISKELIVGSKGGKYFLIKVDFGRGIVGKGIVARSLKIMGDVERFEQKMSKSESEEELFQKVSQVVENVLKKETIPGEVKMKRTTVSTYVPQTSGMDFLIAFLITILVVGVVLIVSWMMFP